MGNFKCISIAFNVYQQDDREPPSVDYTGRGGIYEVFLHKKSATDANVTKCGTSHRPNVANIITLASYSEDL